MFTGTLKFFAALAVVIVILVGVASLYECATSPTQPNAAQRAEYAAQEAEYQTRQAEYEARDKAEQAQRRAEELAQRPHFTPYFAYVTGKWDVECCILYTEEINQGLVVGAVTKGERVQVLSDVRYDSVQVKTKRGLVGYIHPAKYLSVSK